MTAERSLHWRGILVQSASQHGHAVWPYSWQRLSIRKYSSATTAMWEQVAALAAAGRSVLLTSYTNSAVDNVLLKLRAAGVEFLRLGRAASVHAGVSDALPGGARHPAATVAALRQLSATTGVVRTKKNTAIVSATMAPCNPR